MLIEIPVECIRSPMIGRDHSYSEIEFDDELSPYLLELAVQEGIHTLTVFNYSTTSNHAIGIP